MLHHSSLSSLFPSLTYSPIHCQLHLFPIFFLLLAFCHCSTDLLSLSMKRCLKRWLKKSWALGMGRLEHRAGLCKTWHDWLTRSLPCTGCGPHGNRASPNCISCEEENVCCCSPPLDVFYICWPPPSEEAAAVKSIWVRAITFQPSFPASAV